MGNAEGGPRDKKSQAFLWPFRRRREDATVARKHCPPLDVQKLGYCPVISLRTFLESGRFPGI